MKQFFRSVCSVAWMCVLLAACASGHSKAYLTQGKAIAPLVTPPGVPTITQQPYYPVPVVAKSNVPQVTSLLPPTFVKQ